MLVHHELEDIKEMMGKNTVCPEVFGILPTVNLDFMKAYVSFKLITIENEKN